VGIATCPSIFSSPVVHLDNANTTGNFPRRPVDPHNTSDVDRLVQSDTSSQVDKIVQAADTGRPPFHLLVRVLEIGSRSTHGEGELCTFVGEREGHGIWRSNGAENLWRIGDLEPENLTFGSVIGLEQQLHRIDLCNKRSIYAPWNVITGNAPLPEGSQAWYQLTVATGSGGILGRNVEPRT